MGLMVRHINTKNSVAPVNVSRQLLYKITVKFFFICVIAYFAAEQQCYAAKWQVTKKLGVAATDTDNIFLDTIGNEQSERIIEIAPGIEINGRGSRFDFDMEYEIQGVFYDKNNTSDDVFHNLDARGNGELIEDHFFIDYSALYTQRIIDPTVSLPINNLSITSNTSDVGSYSVSPYLRNRFGDSLEGEIRYRYDKVDNRVDTLFDSTSRHVNADLYNREGSQNLIWRLSYQNSDTRSDDGAIWKYERSGLDLRYPITRRFSVLAEGGYETNEYENVDLVDKGSFWNVGILWQPTRRTNLEVRAGERFFGNTGSVSLSHTAHKWNWNLTYNEDFEISNAALLSRQADIVPGDTLSSASDPTISTGTYLSRNFRLAATRTASKTVLNMQLFHYDRELQIQNLNEKTFGANMSWVWKFTRRNEFTFESMWQRQEMEQTNSEIDDSISSASVLHRLTRNSSLSFLYRYQERVVNIPDSNSEQNSYTLQLTMTF